MHTPEAIARLAALNTASGNTKWATVDRQEIEMLVAWARAWTKLNRPSRPAPDGPDVVRFQDGGTVCRRCGWANPGPDHVC